MEEVDHLIERLLAGQETESELGRVRAYRLCVRYAEEQLSTSHVCNLFLLRAAERLGQAPMAVPVVHNRVPLPEGARLCFYYHEDEGATLVGNHDGLSYLSSLCRELAMSPLPGENIVLDPNYEPFVGESDGLTIYCENEDWFDAAEQGTEDELVAQWEAEIESRIMNQDDIAAVQFAAPLQSSVALSPRKIYRVLSLGDWDGNGDLPRKWFRRETERLKVLRLLDDDGEPAALCVDLDDPDVTFFYPWHLDQFSGPQSPSA